MIINRTFEGEQVPSATKWLYGVSGFFREGAFQFVAIFFKISEKKQAEIAEELAKRHALESDREEK
ncbi:MAG: hypothetical protein K6F32_04885 [Bacilli bacterium]|nr:hypothetical protein [Bacilli bacterium]